MAAQKLLDPGQMRQPANADGDAFRVSVRDNKSLVIKASHSWEAVEKYKRKCGIISTDNQFTVEAVEDDGTAVDVELRSRDLPPGIGFNESTPRPQYVKGTEDLGTLGV